MKLNKSSIRLTPTKAKQFLAMNNYVGQRNTSPTHLRELCNKMRDKRFHEGEIAVYRYPNGKPPLLINGQHQCLAVIETGISVDARLHQWEGDTGDTTEGIAALFAQYDAIFPRTRGHIAWYFGALAGMDSWPKRCVRLCNTALGWIAKEINGHGSLYKEDNARLLFEYMDDCEFIHRVAFKGKQEHLWRSPVVAAMIMTRRVDPDSAELFWEAVRDGDMLKQTDPAKKLRELLLRITIRTVRDKGIAVTEREAYARAIHFWNGFRGKGGGSGRYYPDAPLPEPK